MASHRVGLFEVRQAGFLEEEVDLFNPAIGGSLAPAIDISAFCHYSHERYTYSSGRLQPGSA